MAQDSYPTPDALTAPQTFAKAQAIGAAKASMPARRAFVLAVLAGAFIGLGGMLMLLAKSDAALGFVVSSLLGGLCFSLGLFAVIVGGAELFTGNNLMVLGCWGGSYSVSDLLRSWLVVYAGNFVGSLILAAVLLGADFAGMGSGAVGATAVAVAATKCSLPLASMFFRGIMCNFLVCLAVWMGFAGKTVVDKFLAAVFPVTAFVACGFEHCVANMFFLPFGMALAAPDAGVTLAGMATNLAVVTAGNIAGGALFFAGLYWLAFGKREG